MGVVWVSTRIGLVYKEEKGEEKVEKEEEKEEEQGRPSVQRGERHPPTHTHSQGQMEAGSVFF